MGKLEANGTANIEFNGKKLDTFTEPPVAMAQERERTKFPVREMTYYVNGGKEKTEKMEEIMLSLERNPLFSNDDFYDLNKDQQRERTMDKVAVIAETVARVPEDESYMRFAMLNLLEPSTTTRLGVTYGLALNSIRGSGTANQLNYWVSEKGAGTLNKFYGCFAMTELGHGSNVAGLETTAHFDPQTDEFIINTPHVGATKWWIGGAAHTATHTVCYARLIVNGKDYGVKNFVVPLRDVNDFSLKPGVAVGDIGKKMGRDGIDNGWIQFTNVRIPRQYMLMKYSKVDREGNVTEPPLAQLSYGALIGGRVSMASDSFHTAKRFLTIAIRYAAVRRQFSSTPGEPETKLLDYTYHQRRLMPRLAYAFAMRAASANLYAFQRKVNQKLQDTPADDKEGMQSAIEDSKELFAVSAGLKAFCTWATAEIIDQCRQACGGHGYSGYNGFGQAYADWVVQCTWEGDNNVLTLSAGRSLIQSGLAARKGKKVGEASNYLLRSSELANKKLSGRDLTDPAVLIEAFEAASSRGITDAVDKYIELTEKQGLNQTQAFEEISQQRFEIAKIHTRQYLIKSFFESINDAKPELKETLTHLATLFALWSIEQEASSFLVSGFLTAQDVSRVSTLVTEYNKKVRDQAIGITDSFGLSDFFINAPIGNYDGDVYKHYFEKVKRRDPYKDAKAPYHESKIKPFLHRELEDDDDEDLSELDEE